MDQKLTARVLLFVWMGMMIYAFSAVSYAEESDPLSEINVMQVDKVNIAHTEDTDEVLINPGKGFVFMGYMDPEDYLPGFKEVISIGYNRFNWSRIEPEEGKYDWERIDGYIDFYEEQQKQFSFGVMCANTSSSQTYITPKWVFDAGAKGTMITLENGTKQMIPDWTDPVFLEKLNHFIQALAERYDGDPNIAYIDIRSYGNWGEQHTYQIEKAGPGITAEQLKELYFRPYMASFHRTLLATPYGNDEYEMVYQWAIQHGVTIRRDGIGTFSEGEEGGLVAGRLPAIFEYADSYSKQGEEKGDWQYDKIERTVNQGAPSYLEIFQDMYFSNRAFFDKIANRIGYYFRFKEAVYASEAVSGETCDIRLLFRNDGVAPIFRTAFLKIGLLDENYRLVQAYSVLADPSEWLPGENAVVNVSPFFDVEEGDYIIAVGLFADDRDEKPDYQLGNSGGTDDHWYVFGKIKLK